MLETAFRAIVIVVLASAVVSAVAVVPASAFGDGGGSGKHSPK